MVTSTVTVPVLCLSLVFISGMAVGQQVYSAPPKSVPPSLFCVLSVVWFPEGMVSFDPFCSVLFWFDLVRSGLFWFDLVYSALFWFDLTRSGLFWLDLVRVGLIWFDLV